MASVQWNRDNSTPDVPVVSASLWKGVAVALPVSAACWGVIVGLGYLGYRLGQVL